MKHEKRKCFLIIKQRECSMIVLLLLEHQEYVEVS